MKSIPKLLRRFIKILILSGCLLFFTNLLILGIINAKSLPGGKPWVTAERAVEALEQNSGLYSMPEEIIAQLQEEHAWAMYINEEGKVVWHSDDLPESIPLRYSVAEIASLTRGYVDDYPTFTGEGERGLMVLGYPKDRYWKLLWPAWDYQLVANAPKIALSAFLVNVIIVFLIYIIANTSLLKVVQPVINGIQALPTDEAVYIKEKGLLSELAVSINQTSLLLQSQKYQLRKKERARANWIAGVSHDIRTPLSMVMGYAEQLRGETNLTKEEQKKAEIILRQSERIKKLINDLNLASKLDYDMQPLHMERINLVSIVREVTVEIINSGIEESFSVEWTTNEEMTTCFIKADRDLLKRAVVNLIQNSIGHNETGCCIYISVQEEADMGIICVEDDGVGVSEEQLEKLNHATHYIVWDTNVLEQQHGLGLLLVKQIVNAHQGTVKMEHSPYGGFRVELFLPLEKNEKSDKN